MFNSKEEDSPREQYKKRLAAAFKEKWDSLSEEERNGVLNELLDIDGSDRAQTRSEIKDLLKNIRSRNQAFGFLILGLLLGIFGSILGNAIFLILPENIFLYFFLALGGLFILIHVFERAMTNITNEALQITQTLDSLLILVEEKKVKDTSPLEADEL